MWGPEAPRSPSSPGPSCPSPSEADSLLQAAAGLPPDSLLRPPSSFSRDSLESPCSLPSSPPAPPSLGSLLEASSFLLPSDSLEERRHQQQQLAGSFSFTPGDSLEPAPLCPRAALRPLFSLNDTLETSSVQRDSLQSASSTQASSLPCDSLESPCSLFDSLETSLAQYPSSGSHSV